MTGTFLKLKHGFLDAEKHEDLTPHALLLHVCGMLHSSERLTDGRVPKKRVARWAPHFAGDDIDPAAAELVVAGVWTDEGDHWLIVNFLEHNRSKAEVDDIRAKDRDRKKLSRSKTTPDADTDPETGTFSGLRSESVGSPDGQTPQGQSQSETDSVPKESAGSPSGHLADVVDMIPEPDLSPRPWPTGGIQSARKAIR